MIRYIMAALLTASSGTAMAQGGAWDVGGSVGADVRVFFDDPALPNQVETWQPSLILEGDVRWDSESGSHQFVFVPFARLDAEDDERTHFDVREGYYRYIADDYDVLVGASKVFWGVAESRHLVDVINPKPMPLRTSTRKTSSDNR